VRIIVGFAPGGSYDVIARLTGEWLSGRLGQPFITENRPGAGGNIGTAAVANAPPDGYTLLLVGLANVTSAIFYNNLEFNFIRDIVPVAAIQREAFLMVVNPSVPAETVPEFIAYAKLNPSKINMASAGIGTTGHVFGELFKMMTGVDLVHVPYRGAGPALADLLGGQVQVVFASMSSSIEYVRAGKLRALAVTTATRLEALPDIASVSEHVPGYEAVGCHGIGAPKHTSPDIIDRLNRQINAGLADPKFKARLAELGGTAFPGSPADFGKLIADETEKWGKVIRAANIKAE
jgi:tripartite-type tricarboxylate transporter receptor subunit TctC